MDLFKGNTNEFKLGLEVEVMLTNNNYVPLHVADLPFEKMKNVLETIEAPETDYLVVKYPGANSRPYYLEGYDLIDADGEFKSLDVKGIEISTPISFSIPDLMNNFQALYKNLQLACSKENMNLTCFSTHPANLDYQGPRGTRGVKEWAAAEVAMTTFGIHVNASLPLSLENKLNREELYYRFNYFAPALVLLSANSPFRHGELWELGNNIIGKSDRSYRRTFTRDTLYFRDDQNYRKEVTIFDMTNSVELIAAYTALTLGLMLDDKPFPYLPDTFSKFNIQSVSQYGYSSKLYDRHFGIIEPAKLVEDALIRATKSLDKFKIGSHYLNPLYKLLEEKRVPADFMLENYSKKDSDVDFCKKYTDIIIPNYIY